jgi:uncharacterized protein
MVSCTPPHGERPGVSRPVALYPKQPHRPNEPTPSDAPNPRRPRHHCQPRRHNQRRADGPDRRRPAHRAALASVPNVGIGVFHVTDDVELLAQAAIGKIASLPRLIAAATLAADMVCKDSLSEDVVENTGRDVLNQAQVLAGACRWYAFRVSAIDAAQPRSDIVAHVFAAGRLRDFFGLSRAKHAVVEAAILATRLHLFPADTVRDELARLEPLIEKTASPADRRAFQALVDHISQALAQIGRPTDRESHHRMESPQTPTPC